MELLNASPFFRLGERNFNNVQLTKVIKAEGNFIEHLKRAFAAIRFQGAQYLKEIGEKEKRKYENNITAVAGTIEQIIDYHKDLVKANNKLHDWVNELRFKQDTNSSKPKKRRGKVKFISDNELVQAKKQSTSWRKMGEQLKVSDKEAKDLWSEYCKRKGINFSGRFSE